MIPSQMPIPRAAYFAVRKAVLAGVLRRPLTCEICGSTGQGNRSLNIRAHHQDYSRPLAVNWVCDRCHRLLHLIASANTNVLKRRIKVRQKRITKAQGELLVLEWALVENRKPGRPKNAATREITVEQAAVEFGAFGSARNTKAKNGRPKKGRSKSK